MTKNHLKKIATPRTWNINRKENTFVTKAKPGPHDKSLSCALSVFIKDIVGLAATTKNAKYILNEKTVLVNGKRRKDYRFPVGFMDVIYFKEIDKHYRIILNRKGKLDAIEAKKKDSHVLVKI